MPLQIFQLLQQKHLVNQEKVRNFATDLKITHNMMIKRICPLSSYLTDSIFLFGARQTGKSTFLEQNFPDAVSIDLLDSKLKRRFQMQPELLYEMLKEHPQGTIVVIDEIAEVPELLNEVHRLIQKKQLVFVLCGSSARKLHRKGTNTLGGRARPCYFFPFVSAELPDLDLDKALLYGFLPPHYLSKHPENLLPAYIDVYLKEEIKEEAIVRRLDNFQRFLEAAALTSGEIVNYSNIANDCAVKSNTVKSYFSILEDSLIGYMIPAYTKVLKRKVIQAPKFYFFDVGVYNYLLHRTALSPDTPEYGHCFEHFIMQEVRAYIGYNHCIQAMSYWHTYEGKEIDLILGNAEIAIEIKATEEVKPRHLANFKQFKEEFPQCKYMIVSRDTITRQIDDVKAFYYKDFLTELWNGNIIR